MRALAAAALAVLVVVAAGCGGNDGRAAAAANLGADAARLVPPDASAFVAADTDVHSAQWERVDRLTASFPARAKLLDRLRAELQKKGLTWQDDVRPALGREVDVAVLGQSDAVAFAKPDDASKLRTLATKLSTAKEHYTVQEIGDWSVVADAQDLFDRVRAAQNGRSLAATAAFKTAWANVPGDALARAFARPGSLHASPLLARLTGGADWIAARVAADDDALRLELVTQPAAAAEAAADRSLLADVPSGAALAFAFHGSRGVVQALAQTPSVKGFPLARLAPVLNGDGVLYVRPAGLLPEVALELAPANPSAALASARALLRKAGPALGPIPLTAQLVNGKLVIADGPAAVSALRSGPKLTGDTTYKDAIARAGVPARTTFLAYADVPALAPFIELATQAATGKAPDPQLTDNLAHVGTVVAWNARSGTMLRLRIWIRPR